MFFLFFTKVHQSTPKCAPKSTKSCKKLQWFQSHPHSSLHILTISLHNLDKQNNNLGNWPIYSFICSTFDFKLVFILLYFVHTRYGLWRYGEPDVWLVGVMGRWIWCSRWICIISDIVLGFSVFKNTLWKLAMWCMW